MATVLVVEDNSANLKLITLLLENVGHLVLNARDAGTGLTMAAASRPDLILMEASHRCTGAAGQAPFSGCSRCTKHPRRADATHSAEA
jgi:CheY-like chemotaxis protein